MFGFINEVFLGLLSICALESLSGSLVSNSQELLKCVS